MTDDHEKKNKIITAKLKYNYITRHDLLKVSLKSYRL